MYISRSARAMGFPDSPDGIPSSIVDSTLEYAASLHVLPSSIHRPSMLLDAEKGRPMEVEVILGEVVRMARAKGVSIPVSFVSSFNYAFNLRLHFTSACADCSILFHCKRIEMLYALLVVVQNQILRKLEAAQSNRLVH